LSLRINDNIVINNDSAQYIANLKSTAQANKPIDIHLVTGETAAATSVVRIKIPNDITNRVFLETDKGHNITFVRDVNHLMESLNK